MARVALEHVDKVYPNGYVAARDLSLDAADGELLVLVGPSGSGKSTILRLIAGLEATTGGIIRIDGRDVTHLPPQRRDVAMVFQSYALYPHMSVRDNLAFGLRVRRHTDAEITRRVAGVAESLGLAQLLDRKPAQLSGGQRQRVALGRAIVREPLVFLFDEPLSNLDAQLRVETRFELARLHRRLGATMVYVTHDQTEALTLGDRVAVLKDGALQQVAPPMELYRRPANRFVAGFIGSPGMNFLEGGLIQQDGRLRFTSDSLTLELPGRLTTAQPGAAVLGIRPQQLTVAGDGPPAAHAEVVAVESTGGEQIVHLAVGSHRLVATVPPDPPFQAGTIVPISIPADAAYLFDAATGVRLA